MPHPPTPPPKLNVGLSRALAALLVLVACEGTPPAGLGDPATGVDSGTLPPGDDGGIACSGSSPEEGCPCDVVAPRDCYTEPTTTGTTDLLCHRGTRYCRDHVWSACESIHDYTITTESALITGPSPCNPCDPRCFVTRDTPTTGDLTPADSSSAVYDPMRGGVVITSTMVGGGIGQIDLDMNGIPDVSEHCMGLGFATLPNGTCDPSVWILHALLPGHSVTDHQSYSFTLRSADVYILMDTTGSMGGELSNLSSSLTSGSYAGTCGVGQGILGAIQCAIPSAYFGVGFHDDFPYCPDGRCYGRPGTDIVFGHVQDMTSDVNLARTAVGGLTIHNGRDGPEAQIPAFDAITTGGGYGTYLAARTGCPANTWGYPCFRNGIIPIVVNITDAPYHNGPGAGPPYPYCIGGTVGSGAATSVGSCTASGGSRCGDAGFCGTGGSRAIDLGDVTSTYVQYTGNTSSASTVSHFTNWSCGSSGSTSARDMVFHFRLTSTQTVTVTTEGSAYDTMIVLFGQGSGSCPNATSPPAYCNDDFGGTSQSRLDVPLGPGDYYVLVDGYGSSMGAFTLRVGVEPAACTSPTTVPPTFAQTAADLRARGVRVITMQTCGDWTDPYCLQGEAHAIALGRATSSTTPSTTGLCATPTSTNCRSSDAYVYRGNADGSGLSSGIVTAIVDLANYSRTDISAVPVNDTWGFVQSIETRGRTPSGCTGASDPCWAIGPPVAGPTACWLGCTPGTAVDFDINFTNTHAPPGLYFFEVDIISVPGNGVLARIPVRIIVPGRATVYSPMASYWHDYDSTLTCTIDERPVWGTLNYTLDIPAGTRVQFTLTASDDPTMLATATPVATFTVNPPATGTAVTGSRNVDTLLAAAGIQPNLRYLRVNVTLFADSTLMYSPALQAMSLDYTCIPAE